MNTHREILCERGHDVIPNRIGTPYSRPKAPAELSRTDRTHAQSDLTPSSPLPNNRADRGEENKKVETGIPPCLGTSGRTQRKLLPADRSRRLANHGNDQIQRALRQLAQDLHEIAADLERGAIEFRHPELMPQRHSQEQVADS